MFLEDFHVHSTFSDGKNSPEEIVRQAVSLGVTRLGFSDHGYAPYDEDCGIPYDRVEAYRNCVAALKERWRDTIELYCGIEQDLYAGVPPWDFDYVIGSVHYLRLQGRYYAVDDTPEELRQVASEFFAGDYDALAEAYYESVGQVHTRTGCQIIGHFDLITKFSERCPELRFDGPRAERAWKAAAERLLEEGCRIFEINTGAMSRGWRSTPYPSLEIQRYLSRRGAKFILSGDSHSAKDLCYDFQTQKAAAEKNGIPLISFTLPATRGG